MSKSVLERITCDIVKTLQSVIAEAGYDNTLKVVRPSPALSNPVEDGLAIVIQGDCQRDFDCPQEVMQFYQDYHIVLVAVESEKSTTSIDERLNSLQADVETALTIDVNRGRLAEDTVIHEPTRGEVNVGANNGAVVVNVKVQYRTLYNKPKVSIYDDPPTSV